MISKLKERQESNKCVGGPLLFKLAPILKGTDVSPRSRRTQMTDPGGGEKLQMVNTSSGCLSIESLYENEIIKIMSKEALDGKVREV